MQEYHTKNVLPRYVPDVDPEKVKTIVSSLDKRGAWVEEISIPNYKDVVNNPRRKLQGISTRTYINNMKTMINYLKNIEE